jgi:uncharacterized protein YyaL (SSP411 family)
MSASQNTAHLNRLAQATSPYLLQHKHNPVDWWQWGPEALEEAKRTNRPILLSVGYAACHWCHVMDHTTFTNEEVAEIINSRFVPIRVDNDRRPDLNTRYNMGGWPTIAFLTPNGDVLTGATYVPPRQMIDLLNRVADVYRDERDSLISRAEEIRFQQQKDVEQGQEKQENSSDNSNKS